MKRGKYAKAALYSYLYGGKFIERGYNARRLKKRLKKLRRPLPPYPFSVRYGVSNPSSIIHHVDNHLSGTIGIIMLEDSKINHMVS